jgi:hypothetical protein
MTEYKRTISSHGYVKIKVGINHHLSDSNGYAYEHRFIAETKLGRMLNPGEITHHINGNKTDNRSENIEIVSSIAEHFFRHRANNNLRKPSEDNCVILCKCGCGNKFELYDKSGRPRYYISGHNKPDAPTQKAILLVLSDNILTLDEIIKKVGRSRASVKMALFKLNNAGIISRVGFAIYGPAGSDLIKKQQCINCKCGCGKTINKYDRQGRVRSFISGHNLMVGYGRQN